MEVILNREPDVVAANSQLARRFKLRPPHRERPLGLDFRHGDNGRTLCINPGS